MKTYYKIFLTYSLLICISATLGAQTIRKRFTSDLHFGLNIAEMDIEGANMYKQPKLGANLGVNFNYKILGNIQLQTGFYVTKKGLKQHIRTDQTNDFNVRNIGDTVRNTTASYIQIPLSLGYEVYFSKKFAFNINAGVYAAYGFKGKHKVEAYKKTFLVDDRETPPEYMTPTEEETFALRKLKRFDYGGIASVGFIYDIYTINLNYEYGLYNVSDDERILKNRNISILLGFRF